MNDGYIIQGYRRGDVILLQVFPPNRCTQEPASGFTAAISNKLIYELGGGKSTG